MFILHRLFIWVKRFRHRCGYGVHSPSDFFLITFVMYEKYPYYEYKSLRRCKYDKTKHQYREKVNKLLFRMSNYLQPKSFIEVGEESGASFNYMQTACKSMEASSVSDVDFKDIRQSIAEHLNNRNVISCLHIGNTPFYKEIMNLSLNWVDENSWIIVGGIHDSKEKEMWWNEIINDNRVVISFDLYDVGFLFFKSKRYKQNYIVNFL